MVREGLLHPWATTMSGSAQHAEHCLHTLARGQWRQLRQRVNLEVLPTNATHRSMEGFRCCWVGGQNLRWSGVHGIDLLYSSVSSLQQVIQSIAHSCWCVRVCFKQGVADECLGRLHGSRAGTGLVPMGQHHHLPCIKAGAHKPLLPARIIRP